MSSNSNSDPFDFHRLLLPLLQNEYWRMASRCYWQGEIPLLQSPNSFVLVCGLDIR
jgi:hypothetical protein